MTSRFKVGDRVVLEGVIEEMDSSDLPLKVRYGGDVGAYEWIQDGPHIHHTRHDYGLLPMQLEAVTKERDDAREQVGLLTRELQSPRDAYKALQSFADGACKERDDAREQLARACAQVETLTASLKAERATSLRVIEESRRRGSPTDTRILDCMQTLLAMRETP